MHCFIVDDNLEDIISLEEALSDIADQIDTAETYADAMIQIDRYEKTDVFPHIAFVDFSIDSQSDGAELILKLQNLHTFSAIIIMTGDIGDDVARAAEKLNVDVILKDSVADDTIIPQICLKAITRWNGFQRAQIRNFEARRKDFLLALSKISHDIRGMILGLSSVGHGFRLEASSSGMENDLIEENERLMDSAIDTADHVLGKLTSYGAMTKNELSLLPIDPTETIEEILEECFVGTGLKIHISSSVHGTVALDRKVVSHLMRILAQNVMMHCPDCQAVDIVLELLERDEFAILVVKFSDNGPGIKEELRTKIFEPTFRENSPGSGMGLASAADVVSTYVVDNLRASISCDSRSDGKSGACFEIRLPCRYR